jgi:hypothetical protein
MEVWIGTELPVHWSANITGNGNRLIEQAELHIFVVSASGIFRKAETYKKILLDRHFF